MRGFAVFAAALIATTAAHARFARSPLDQIIARTAAVMDVRITSARAQDWRSSEGVPTCGYVYEASVNEALKGSWTSPVTFASPEGLRVGGRYLLFFDSYAGDFPTDVHYRRPSDEEARRQACLDALPVLKASWLHWARFLPNEFVELSYWLVPPDETNPSEISIESVRNRGEFVDFESPMWDRPPEVDALFYEYWLGSTVLPWSSLRSAIKAAVLRGDDSEGSP